MEPDREREQRLALLRSDLAYLARKVARWTAKGIGQVGLVYLVGFQVSRFLWPEERLPNAIDIGEGLVETWVEWLLNNPLDVLLLLAGMFYGCYLLAHLVGKLANRWLGGSDG